MHVVHSCVAVLGQKEDTHRHTQTATHLLRMERQSGPGRRRPCSSGAGTPRPTQSHGTLQNRHVKSQARESHWKKIRESCAKIQTKGFSLCVCVCVWMDEDSLFGDMAMPGKSHDYHNWTVFFSMHDANDTGLKDSTRPNNPMIALNLTSTSVAFL